MPIFDGHKDQDSAYIICMNDSMRFVVLHDEAFAQQVLIKARSAHINKIKPVNQEEYNNTHYWHLHEVPLCEKKGANKHD